MNTDSVVEIDAPASVVWDVYADVERWPEWTPSVSALTALDGPLAVGHRFDIKQPRVPKLMWEVIDLNPGTSWTWRQQTSGATTIATHEILTQRDGSTLVRQRIDQRGPIGILVGVLTRRMTKRALDLEAQGLKARSEDRVRRGAPR